MASEESDRIEYFTEEGGRSTSQKFSPYNAMALGDYYVNQALGIELKKPEGWHFLSANEWIRLQSIQAMHMPDTESYIELLQLGYRPLLVVSTQPDYVPTLEPAVGFYVSPVDPNEPFGLVEQYQATAQVLQGYLDDFVLDECGACEFLGQAATHMKYRYTMWIDSTQHRGEGRSIAMRTPRLEWNIDFGWAEGEKSEAEFAVIEKSLRFR